MYSLWPCLITRGYIQNWVISFLMEHVGKYSSTMEHMGALGRFFFGGASFGSLRGAEERGLNGKISEFYEVLRV